MIACWKRWTEVVRNASHDGKTREMAMRLAGVNDQGDMQAIRGEFSGEKDLRFGEEGAGTGKGEPCNSEGKPFVKGSVRARARREWKGSTGGGAWGQRALIFLLGTVGLRCMYGVLALVVPFYMLFARTGYLSIYRYFRQRLGYSCWRSFTGTYRNHFVFGQVVLDRFAVFAGRGDRFEVVVRGEEHFTRLSNGERGFIIAGSHVGNFEIAGYLLDASVKRVNALVFPGETRTMQEGRAGVLGRRNTRLVPVEEDMSHLFLARAALGAGEIVSMSCDRLSGSSRGVTCDFLGGRATFPAGPFALAVHAGVEVLSVFVLKEGWRRYAVHVRPTCGEVPEGATRGERVEALARAFAGELEAIVRRYPTQWFNYYRFWKDQ